MSRIKIVVPAIIFSGCLNQPAVSTHSSSIPLSTSSSSSPAAMSPAQMRESAAGRSLMICLQAQHLPINGLGQDIKTARAKGEEYAACTAEAALLACIRQEAWLGLEMYLSTSGRTCAQIRELLKSARASTDGREF